jgi:ABC-2 type transport system ATP-binding protein
VNDALRLRGVTVEVGGRRVLDQVSFEVAKGEFCGLCGPNGGGKTTLLKVALGLLTPASGEVSVLGRPPHEARRHVGYLPQAKAFNNAFPASALELILANQRGAWPLRVNAAARERARRALLRVGGERLLDAPLRGLSGGELQRVFLARALVNEPALLLLDEPTAGVDPKARRDFWEEIHKLAATGLTFLITTHYMDEASRCHRLGYIAYGNLLAHGTVDEVIRAGNLTTWEVTGENLSSLAEKLRGLPGVEQVVAFGTALHVSGRDAAKMQESLTPHFTGPQQWTKIDSGLEDVFISLMETAKDNFS